MSAPVAARTLSIAVIDSGVNLNHPHIFAPTRGVVLSGDAAHDSFEDTVGHGTAVMAAIQEKVPDAEYLAVKLFGSTLRSSSGQLMRAIEWAIEERVSVVNLSLGTPNFDFREPMLQLVARAHAAGVLLVAARNAAPGQPVLPGSLPGVIGVDVDWTLPRDRFRFAEDVFYASGYPRSLPGVPPARNLNGVSFAVANMTAFVARVCAQSVPISFESVRQSLIAEASRLP